MTPATAATATTAASTTGGVTQSTATQITRRPVNVSIWIDNFTAVAFFTRQNLTVGNATTMLPTAERPAWMAADATIGPWIETRTFSYTTTPGRLNTIPPGKHTIHACIDCDPRHLVLEYYAGDNKTLEPNETNNYVEQDIYLANSEKPIIEAIHGIRTPYLASDSGSTVRYNNPFKGSWHPGENMSVWANVSDLDQAHLNVSFRFALKDSNVTRDYTACGPTADRSLFGTSGCVFTISDSHSFRMTLRDFGRATNNSTETWYVTTIANNSFGKVTVSDPTTLTLTRWPLHAENQTHVVFGIRNTTADAVAGTTTTYYPDNSTFAYGVDGPLDYWIHLDEAWTGVTDQANVTHNIAMRVDFPNNKTKTFEGPGYFTEQFDCDPVQPSDNPGDVVGDTVRPPASIARSIAATCVIRKSGRSASRPSAIPFSVT